MVAGVNGVAMRMALHSHTLHRQRALGWWDEAMCAPALRSSCRPGLRLLISASVPRRAQVQHLRTARLRGASGPSSPLVVHECAGGIELPYRTLVKHNEVLDMENRVHVDS
jgi:hypothetical protein